MISDGEFLAGFFWYFGLNPIFLGFTYLCARAVNGLWLAMGLAAALAALDYAAIAYYSAAAHNVSLTRDQTIMLLLYRIFSGGAVFALARARRK